MVSRKNRIIKGRDTDRENGREKRTRGAGNSFRKSKNSIRGWS